MNDINNYCVTIMNSQNQNLEVKRIINDIVSWELSNNKKITLLTEMYDVLFKLTIRYFNNREYLEMIKLMIEQLNQEIKFNYR